MFNQAFRKRFISLTTLSSILIVEIFAFLGLYALFCLQIKYVYKRIYIITIIFILINIIIFIVCLFCIRSYQNIHRTFLVSIIIIYTVTMTFLSYFIYTFRDDFLEATGVIWEKGIQKSIDAIESRFNCKGFDKAKPDSTCYDPINQFLQNRSKVYSVSLGLLSVLFIVLTFASMYFAYKSRHADAAEPTIMSMTTKDLNDIKEPLNLDNTIHI